MGRIEGMSLSTILLILAFIAFVLAAIGWSYRKTNLLETGDGRKHATGRRVEDSV